MIMLRKLETKIFHVREKRIQNHISKTMNS